MHDFDLYKVLEIDYVHDKYTHTLAHTHTLLLEKKMVELPNSYKDCECR